MPGCLELGQRLGNPLLGEGLHLGNFFLHSFELGLHASFHGRKIWSLAGHLWRSRCDHRLLCKHRLVICQRVIGLIEGLQQHKQALNVAQFDRSHRRASTPDKRHFFLIHVDPKRVERERHLTHNRSLQIKIAELLGHKASRPHARQPSRIDRMLGVHVFKLQRLIPFEKSFDPLIWRSGIKECVVEVVGQPRPAMPLPLAVWPTQLFAPLRPCCRDRPKASRLRLGRVFQGMVAGHFQIGHRIGLIAAAHGIIAILKASPRMRIAQRHLLDRRSGAGLVAHECFLPHTIADHIERFGSGTHLHAHLKRIDRFSRRAMGCANS